MKNYGLSNDRRKTVLLILFVISLIVGTYLYPHINNLLNFACSKIHFLKSFLNTWEHLGIFPTQVTVIAVYSFLSWWFNNHLWKCKLLKNILNVPNLNGVWEGGYTSSRVENGKTITAKGEMHLTIEQTFEKMVCRSTFSKSESFSDVIYLDVDSPQGVVLKFTYTNKSHDITCDLPEFSGYNELTLSGTDTLTGTYYTKRIPSTRGELLLIRRNPSDDINEVHPKE